MARESYADLPVLPGVDLPHARHLLDSDMGSIGLLSPAHVRAAASLVDRGESISLSVPIGFIDPPLFGRSACRHRYLEVGRNTFEDVLDDFNPQAGSQWDGLLHVRAREQGFFDGHRSIADAAQGRGIEAWASNGIVGRGVLLDVGRWAARAGRHLDPMSGAEITTADLSEVAADQGIEIESGDILCLRTGWIASYRALDEEGRQSLPPRFAGLRADESTARYLWDHEIAAVCADNPALECAPGDPAVGSLHRRLIPTLGIAIGELFDFDRVASSCADRGRWTFLFVSAPLPLPGGVSSPANALAIL
jgi:kynurenine formamidase